MADAIFENPRLTEIYDAFDCSREDLDHYLALAQELGAKSVLDVGCGTGNLACLLSRHRFDVIGVDPAQASLEMAYKKPHAAQVRWLLGDATTLPPLSVDLAVMTGNVAQVFLTDDAWEESLRALRACLKPKGHLVFEVRDPAKKAWLNWIPEKTYQRLDIPRIGNVEASCTVTGVSGELVSFTWTYVFEADGQAISSDSTLRFRDKEAIVESLERCGFVIKDVRDAPDRPGQEFVFIATVA